MTLSSLFSFIRATLTFQITHHTTICCGQHAALFDVGSGLRHRLSKAEPGKGQCMVQPMERIHRTLERSARYGSHVDRAIQVLPGGAEIALTRKVGVNRTGVFASDIGSPAA